MNRRQALAKATVTTADFTTGLLPQDKGRAFVRSLKDNTELLSRVSQRVVAAPSGEVDKLSTASRIIRKATENSDDGYRVGAAFGSVGYTTVKVRLPWELTEDALQENIEQKGFEGTMLDEMTTQFGLDIEDLGINGDTAAVGTDAPFLTIDDGWVKQVRVANRAGRNIDGSTINGGSLSKEHFFAARRAMPRKYRNRGGLVWVMSDDARVDWWEYLTNRAGAQGDGLLGGNNAVSEKPLGYDIVAPPAWPNSELWLVDPKNLVHVISWAVRRRRVTGETDAELAAKDKRFYVFHTKQDYIIEELDAVVRVSGLV